MCGVCGIDECDDEFWCKVEEEIQEVGSWNIGDDDEDAAQQALALDGAAAPKASGDLPADVLDGEGDSPEPPRQ